jgi:serine/threonine protein kinase
MALQVGEQVGAYTITGSVGKGGMATVYQAQHTRLSRDVAIKVMHPSLLQDDNFRARFEREARIVASLEHSNVVSIYDFDEHEGQPYLVMKYVKGPTLKRYASSVDLRPKKQANS